MFYLVKIQNDTTVGIFKFDDLDSALSAYHSELAYRGDMRKKTICVILDAQGFTYCREVWQKIEEQEIQEEK